MKSKIYRYTKGLLIAAFALLATTASGSYLDLLQTLEENEAITAGQAASLRDKAPKFTIRPASGAVKDIAIRGRVQTQFGYVDAKNDEGSDSYSTFEVRRARIGLRGTLFDNFRAQIEGNFVPGSGLSMRSAFIQWREHKPAYIKLGYDKPKFSFEENTSSASILTIERTLISNSLAPGAMNGLSLDGSHQRLSYAAGIYTDQNNRNQDGADNYLLNASVGLSLDDLMENTKLRLRADYLNSDDEAGKFGDSHDDAMAFSVHMAHGGFDLRAEYLTSSNDDSEVNGFYITPSVYLTKKFQAVARYEKAESDSERGLSAPSRYLRRVDSLSSRDITDIDGNVIDSVDPRKGDDYQALYFGLNYYLAGDGHKLMMGVEMSELDNTDAGKLEGTTVYTAWRMLF